MADSSSNAPTSSVVVQTQHNFSPAITTTAAKEEISKATKAMKSMTHDANATLNKSNYDYNKERLNSEERRVYELLYFPFNIISHYFLIIHDFFRRLLANSAAHQGECGNT